MPPEARDPTDPKAWLLRARSSLSLAKRGSAAAGVVYEDLCFEAQRAAEKALKAVLVSQQMEFPNTQSIETLHTLLSKAGIDVPQHVLDASELTRHATTGRYPGSADEVEADDYTVAVALAEGVVRWAEEVVPSTDADVG